MVFPSLPIYLDPPNWSQQEPNNYHPQEGISGPIPASHHQPPPPPTVDGGYQSSIRPGSMADRARLAKIHQPEAAMKCPRCESTNTKFCYYNNYSLSQPRHFCKTCRRYWTRGGALRNVPVGGGCRRNKRSKGSNRSSNSNSKSPMKGTGSSSASANSSSSVCTTTDVNVMIHHLPFLASNLHHHYNNNNYILGGRNGNTSSEFQIGNNDGGFEFSNNGVSEQWRLPQLQLLHQQHFPNLLTNLEQPQFQFNSGENNNNNNNNGEPSSRFRANGVSGILLPQLKMEENEGGMSLAAKNNNNMLSGSGNGTNLFWNGSSGNGNGNGNVWSEVVPSNFTSPSPSHLL